jgi:hypothetical protein
VTEKFFCGALEGACLRERFGRTMNVETVGRPVELKSYGSRSVVDLKKESIFTVSTPRQPVQHNRHRAPRLAYDGLHLERAG